MKVPTLFYCHRGDKYLFTRVFIWNKNNRIEANLRGEIFFGQTKLMFSFISPNDNCLLKSACDFP